MPSPRPPSLSKATETATGTGFPTVTTVTTNRDGYRGYGQWQSINARQANLDRRIDIGVRNGSLTRSEAVRLRAEFRQISYLEQRYRRTGNGLNAWERQDLDRRFDRLSARIRSERRDGQDYRGYRRY